MTVIENNICIVCKNNLTKENTKVKENQKYIKYKKIICSRTVLKIIIHKEI